MAPSGARRICARLSRHVSIRPRLWARRHSWPAGTIARAALCRAWGIAPLALSVIGLRTLLVAATSSYLTLIQHIFLVRSGFLLPRQHRHGRLAFYASRPPQV